MDWVHVPSLDGWVQAFDLSGSLLADVVYNHDPEEPQGWYWSVDAGPGDGPFETMQAACRACEGWFERTAEGWV